MSSNVLKKDICRSPIYNYRGKIEFTAYGTYVDTEEEVNIFLEAVRRNFTIHGVDDHNTTFPFALRLCRYSNSDVIEYYEDDNEIGCGSLLMNALIRRNLENVIIVVSCSKSSCFSPDFIQVETLKQIRLCAMDCVTLLHEKYMKSSTISIGIVGNNLSSIRGSVHDNVAKTSENQSHNIDNCIVQVKEKVDRDLLNMKPIVPNPDQIGLEMYLGKELDEAKQRKNAIKVATVAPFKFTS